MRIEAAAPFIGASLLASGLYASGVCRRPPWLGVVSRALAVGALALMAWRGHQGWLLAVALSLAALGEVALALDPKTGLALGLCSGLLAEAAFIVIFAHAGGGILMFRSEPVRLAGLLAAVSAAVLVLRLVWPRLGPLTGVLSVFALAVAAMTAVAFTLPWGRWPAMAGAFALLGAEGLLAVQHFGPRPGTIRAADGLAWWIRYCGLAAIALGFLVTFRR